MRKLKNVLKEVFYKTNSLWILDLLNYWTSKIRNLLGNKNFKKTHPNFSVPPDYYLYETFSLNYNKYKDSGELAAREIISCTKPYIERLTSVLEWGCGVARIIRHIPSLNLGKINIVGADINKQMIKWNSTHIPDIKFVVINYFVPTPFKNAEFNLIFASSVFTHIESEFQVEWIKEIYRILSDGGIFYFTTHGKKYESNLNTEDLQIMRSKRVLTKSYRQKGHRMMTTYNTYDHFQELLQPFFTVLEYYDGLKFPDKVGGQDMWIVKK